LPLSNVCYSFSNFYSSINYKHSNVFANFEMTKYHAELWP
jgi:hypothetical protein